MNIRAGLESVKRGIVGQCRELSNTEFRRSGSLIHSFRAALFVVIGRVHQ
jgi:hypothetical protein